MLWATIPTRSQHQALTSCSHAHVATYVNCPIQSKLPTQVRQLAIAGSRPTLFQAPFGLVVCQLSLAQGGFEPHKPRPVHAKTAHSQPEGKGSLQRAVLLDSWPFSLVDLHVGHLGGGLGKWVFMLDTWEGGWDSGFHSIPFSNRGG